MMKFTSISFVVLFVPSLAFADTHYFSGTQRTDPAARKTAAPISKVAPVLVQLDVTPTTVTEFEYKSRDSQTVEVSVRRFVKQGAGWVFKGKQDSPAKIDFDGMRVRSISLTQDAQVAKTTTRIDLSNPLVYASTSTFSAKGVDAYTTTVDAGLIIKHQFDALMKDKRKIAPLIGKPGAPAPKK